MELTIDPDIADELAYIVELHEAYGAPAEMGSLEELIAYVLAVVAEGSRRPGSWERQVLTMMGLLADCPENQEYRST